MTPFAAVVLAHQSDWSTTALVCVPLAFFAWLLHLARRRAEAARQARHTPDAP